MKLGIRLPSRGFSRQGSAIQPAWAAQSDEGNERARPNAAIAAAIGMTMFFFPAVGRARWPWDLGDRVNVQLLGALFLSISTISFWSWHRPSWYGYDLLYPGAGTFASVAQIASLLHWNLFANHPIASPIFVAVYILGAVLGFYPYIRYVLRRPAGE